MLYSICVETIEDADLAMCGPDGQETMRLRDVPFHAAAREIIFNEPIAYLRTRTKAVLVVKMLARNQRGKRLLGEYTFNHSPS